jgi:hypothetical protein
MTDEVLLSGGCHCGRIRYQVRTVPARAFYCHCTICRRLSGSAAMTLAQVAIGDFAYVAGTPAVYRSSAGAERRFCPDCGSQLEFRRRPDPQTVEFTIGTLDDPARVAPRVHLFTDERLPWFETTDELPRRRQLTE